MFINYLKISVRYLLKNRTFSLINIFGLTLGFLCFVLISLYLYDELSFDQFHADSKSMFRLVQEEQTEDGSIRKIAPVASQIAPESIKQIPEVQDALRFFVLGRITMGNDPASRSYERTLTADDNFFTFFNFPLIEGDPKTALTTPGGIVLSQKAATRYFGNEPAMGKRLWTSLTRNGQPVEMVVTGIMKDFPKNSHLQMDMVFSNHTWPTIFPWYENFFANDWDSNSCVSYIKIKDGADLKTVERKLTALVKSKYPVDKTFRSSFSLQSMTDIHLYSDGIEGNEVNANGIKPFYLYMFTAVAVLILLIASLNYMNLSTAAAFKRTREIGTRKTLGAMKGQLIGQFTGEAAILSTISLVLAISILQVILPAVNSFTEKELSLSSLPLNWIYILVGAVIFAGVCSSLYPAFIISRVKPAEALKKEVRLGNRSLPIRKLLVVAQFAISILMIACTLVIYQQLQFMKKKALGFTLDNLLVVDINSDRLRRNFETVKAEFSSVPEVQSISTSTRVPGEWKSFPIATVQTNSAATGTEMIYVGIDNDFMKTYNIKLLEGRNFVPNKSDSLKVILTKLAVEQLNLTNPVGQIIEIPSVRQGGSIDKLEKPFRAEIIGVADNFHFESFRQKMMPLILAYPNTAIQRIDYYTLRIKTNNWSETIAKLKEVNTRIDANNPMEYTFLNSQFETFYKADEKRGQTFLIFSSIIVLISCLGLFALVSFAIEQRIKEIGIRKVLGASVQSIVGLVAKEFLTLVVIAGVIAIPVSYWLMKNWLQDFAYQIPLSMGLFAAAGILAVVIAFVTISFRTIKAAISNPVDSLRNE
jgi:putative ABC transport system permease protein